jgi:hypothetical protein
LRLASVSFQTFLSMNDTGILVPGRARSEHRTSGGRAKPESSTDAWRLAWLPPPGHARLCVVEPVSLAGLQVRGR